MKGFIYSYVFRPCVKWECVIGCRCVRLTKWVMYVCVVPDSWLVPASEPAANRMAAVSSCGFSSLQQSFNLSNVFQNGRNYFVAGGSWEPGGGESHFHVAPELLLVLYLISKQKLKHSALTGHPIHISSHRSLILPALFLTASHCRYIFINAFVEGTCSLKKTCERQL